jgi:isochorismate synthase
MADARRPSSEERARTRVAGFERALSRVRAEGRTRWVAEVVDAPVGDPLDAHAHAGRRDRFLWERAEDGVAFCAWGCLDETESRGPGRFDDLRAWAEDVRGRIDWIGAPRPVTAPLFVGGFGFEDEAASSADWKAFPAARFLLPEVIVERGLGIERRVLLARVEPGSTRASVEDELARRHHDARVATRPRAAAPAAETVGLTRAGLEDLARHGPDGPRFVVRSDRRHSTFRAQVRGALAEIGAGRLDKVVLARSLAVDHDGAFDEPAFLERLRALYPSCTLIAFGRGDDSFVAATPETLARVDGRRVETAALAGSAPRGRSPEEDRRLAHALRSSGKETAEHAHVVEALRAGLEPLCETLDVAPAPRLRPLFGIQHLETPIHGRLRAVDACGAAVDVLGIVRALHPTPAVGGRPAAAARAWLRRYEGLERGWYAAPIGWLDREGGGDFRVALRSALIRNHQGSAGEPGASRALLFGGAGIVAGSDPEAELVETRIKLRALLAPLTEI